MFSNLLQPGASAFTWPEGIEYCGQGKCYNAGTQFGNLLQINMLNRTTALQGKLLYIQPTTTKISEINSHFSASTAPAVHSAMITFNGRQDVYGTHMAWLFLFTQPIETVLGGWVYRGQVSIAANYTNPFALIIDLTARYFPSDTDPNNQELQEVVWMGGQSAWEYTF